MVDIARNIIVRDVDIRAFIALTLTILLSEFMGAYETAGIIILGILWAFATTSNVRFAVNGLITTIESKIAPITTTENWKSYGQPVAYLLFILFVTFIAVI